MEWATILLGFILSVIFLKNKAYWSKKKETMPKMTRAATKETTTTITTPPAILNENPRRPSSPSFFPGVPSFLAATPTWDIAATRAFNQLQRRNEKPREKALVNEWKQSIIGLIRLADQNLRLAEHHIEMTDFKIAIQTAATSVENIARALIHCYGGKPDDDLGQEEVLKLLSWRFDGEEKNEFELAIHKVAEIHVCTKNSLQATSSCLKDAQDIISLAHEVNVAFKKILVIHFTQEIPELEDSCPKCGSFDVETWGVNRQQANCACRNCRHKWTAT